MDSVQPLVVSAHLFALLLVLVASVMSVPLPVQNTSANGTNNSTALLHDQSVIALYPTCLTSSVVMTTTAASSALAPLATIHSGSSTINSTSCAFLAQQPSGFGITAQATSLAPVPVPKLTTVAFPSVTATPTQVLIPQLGNNTVQPSVATSTPAVVILFTDNGGMLSQRVMLSMIFGFALFVACFVTFCCFWRGECCFGPRRQQPQPSPQPPARRRRRPSGGHPVVRLTFPLIGTAVNILLSRPSSRGSNWRMSDTTLASPTGAAREIEDGKDLDLTADAGPSSPRLSSNTFTTLAASGGRSCDESGQDPAGDAGPSSPRSSSSNTVITVVASEGHLPSPSGRLSIADGIEMVAPIVTRPPAARTRHARPRNALMEAGPL